MQIEDIQLHTISPDPDRSYLTQKVFADVAISQGIDEERLADLVSISIRIPSPDGHRQAIAVAVSFPPIMNGCQIAQMADVLQWCHIGNALPSFHSLCILPLSDKVWAVMWFPMCVHMLQMGRPVPIIVKLGRPPHTRAKTVIKTMSRMKMCQRDHQTLNHHLMIPCTSLCAVLNSGKACMHIVLTNLCSTALRDGARTTASCLTLSDFSE